MIYLLIFILLELIEASWQKSNTLYGYISNNYYYFKKNIFLYFLLHLTFIYSIFLSIHTNNFDFWMSSIIVVKFFDITFKLFILQKINNGKELNEIISFNIKLPTSYKYLGVVIYPLCYFFSII